MADWMVGWADGRAEPAALLLIEKAIMPVVMTVTACTFNAVVERAAAVAPCIVQRQCARLCTRAAAARLREGSLARKQMGAMQWACIPYSRAGLLPSVLRWPPSVGWGIEGKGPGLFSGAILMQHLQLDRSLVALPWRRRAL